MIVVDTSDSSIFGYNWRVTDDYLFLLITPSDQKANKEYIFRISDKEYNFATDRDGNLKAYVTDVYKYNSLLNDPKNAILKLVSNGNLCSYSSNRFVNGDYEFMFDNGRLIGIKAGTKSYMISYALTDITIPSSVDAILSTIIE